jgi:hypothetical protein
VSTSKWSILETIGSRPIMPKILAGHGEPTKPRATQNVKLLGTHFNKPTANPHTFTKTHNPHSMQVKKTAPITQIHKWTPARPIPSPKPTPAPRIQPNAAICCNNHKASYIMVLTIPHPSRRYFQHNTQQTTSPALTNLEGE